MTALGTAAMAQESAPETRTITVRGQGEARGAPDLAMVQIGVQTRSSEAGKAVSQNSAHVRKIGEALAGHGVEERDVQTVNFSVTPRQDRDRQTGQPVGPITFIVDHALAVRVRDLARLGDVLGASVTAGANHIQAIQFEASEPGALEARARKAAMADARERAQQLAAAAGVTLGGPVSIVESDGRPGPTPRFAAEAASVASVPVAPGQLTVGVGVLVVYSIE